MFKQCSKCKEDKALSLFYANKRMRDGFNTFCIDCHKADNTVRKQKNRADAEFKAQELAYKKQYRERTVDQRAQYMTQWRVKNVEHTVLYGKTYRANNKALTNFLCQKRKIALLNRTPDWLTSDDFWIIEEAYELAEKRTNMFGFSWHVDHTIPLRGKLVSGLHVPQNLRVIPAKENMRKTNRYEV